MHQSIIIKQNGFLAFVTVCLIVCVCVCRGVFYQGYQCTSKCNIFTFIPLHCIAKVASLSFVKS